MPGFNHSLFSQISRLVYSLLGLLFFLGSCTSPRFTVKYAKADSTFVCNTGLDHVYPFLEGEPIKFPYKRLGRVEVISNNRHYHDNMMQELMRNASKECANAVIGIYPDQLVVLNKQNMRVLRSRINGLAVLVNEDSLFKSKYKNYRKDMNLTKQDSD